MQDQTEDRRYIEYRSIEKEFSDAQEPPHSDKGDQFYRVIRNLLAEVRNSSLKENLSPDDYRERVSTAIGLLKTLRSALSPRKPDNFAFQNDQYIWHHWSNEAIVDYKGTQKEAVKAVDRHSVLEAAAMYLMNPWLQHDPIDYFIIDSLLCIETICSREQIRSGLYRGKMDFAYNLLDGEMRKVELYKDWFALIVFVLRYILPFAVLGYLYMTDHKTALSISGAIYAVYLFIRGITFPLRVYHEYYINNNFLLPMNNIFGLVQTAYRYWEPPIINLKIFRSSLDKLTNEKGIFVDPVIFTLLKRLEEIHGETFIPFAKWDS